MTMKDYLKMQEEKGYFFLKSNIDKEIDTLNEKIKNLKEIKLITAIIDCGEDLLKQAPIEFKNEILFLKMRTFMDEIDIEIGYQENNKNLSAKFKHLDLETILGYCYDVLTLEMRQEIFKHFNEKKIFSLNKEGVQELQKTMMGDVLYSKYYKAYLENSLPHSNKQNPRKKI